MNIDVQGRAEAAEQIRKIHQRPPNDLRRSTMLDSIKLTDVEKRERDAALAHAEGLLRAGRDEYGNAIAKGDSRSCLDAIRDIHNGGSGAPGTSALGTVAKRLMPRAAQPGEASIDAIKKVHERPRRLDPHGMYELSNPGVVGKRMRTESITVNGRPVFKLEMPDTMEAAPIAGPDTGATTGVTRQPAPSQRVSVFGRAAPEDIGNGRTTVAVDSAESATTSGGQNDSLELIKQAMRKPLPYLR